MRGLSARLAVRVVIGGSDLPVMIAGSGATRTNKDKLQIVKESVYAMDLTIHRTPLPDTGLPNTAFPGGLWVFIVKRSFPNLVSDVTFLSFAFFGIDWVFKVVF